MLKADKKAILTATFQATKAKDFLGGLQSDDIIEAGAKACSPLSSVDSCSAA